MTHLLQIKLTLLPEDRQPKHSYRYGSNDGEFGVESIYIKRSAFKGKAPDQIMIEIKEVP